MVFFLLLPPVTPHMFNVDLDNFMNNEGNQQQTESQFTTAQPDIYDQIRKAYQWNQRVPTRYTERKNMLRRKEMSENYISRQGFQKNKPMTYYDLNNFNKISSSKTIPSYIQFS